MKLGPAQKEVAVRLYEELLEEGLNRKEIAEHINEDLGLDLEESTYRKAFYAHKAEMMMANGDEEVYQQRLLTLARKDLKQKEERKKLVRQRALVDQRIRDIGDKSAVAMAIESIWHQATEKVPSFVAKSATVGNKNYRIYAWGDPHWGYNIDNGAIKYNPSVTMERMDNMFRDITTDIVSGGWTEVYLADLADDIEGAALRASQLLNIAESMTSQAKAYTEYLKDRIKKLVELFPNVKFTFIHIGEDNHSQLRLHNSSRDELPDNLQLLITHTMATFINTAHEFGALKNLTYVTAPEVLMNFDGMNVVFSHTHQYRRSDNILDLLRHKFDTDVQALVGAHWHAYSHKNRNTQNGAQESLIWVNSIVGDTEYSDRLSVSGRPGFVMLTVVADKKYIKSEQVLLD